VALLAVVGGWGTVVARIGSDLLCARGCGVHLDATTARP
jgi:hypothetical protein